MKIKFVDIKNELLRHCIIHLINEDIINETHKNNGVIDLTLKINGHELNMLKWFNRMEKEIDRSIEDKAFELVEDKLNNVESEFYDIVDEAREKIKLR